MKFFGLGKDKNSKKDSEGKSVWEKPAGQYQHRLKA